MALRSEVADVREGEERRPFRETELRKPLLGLRGKRREGGRGGRRKEERRKEGKKERRKEKEKGG